MILDPVVILLPYGLIFLTDYLFTGMYIFGGWGFIFLLLFLQICGPHCHYRFEQNIVLVVGTSFLGGTVMEVCGFFSPIEQRLAR